MQLSLLETKGSKRRRRILKGVLFISAFVATIAASKMSTAGFSHDDLRAHVKIDGLDYGSFDKIDGLYGSNTSSIANEEVSFKKVTLKRDFVTDPSLYLWAQNMMRGRSDLKDIHVVLENSDGEEVSRYVLKFCQPLSWTVEAANPALGGFHEKIDLAVQEIAIF